MCNAGACDAPGEILRHCPMGHILTFTTFAREDVRRWCSAMAGFPSKGSALYAAERAVQRPRRGSTAQAGFDQQASAMADAEVRTPEDHNGATGSQILPSQCMTSKRSTLLHE